MGKVLNSKKVGICGHFYGKTPTSSGQIIKTRIVTDELRKKYGNDYVMTVDTHGGLKAMLLMILRSLRMFRKCQSIVILPAQNGLKVIAPLFSLYNLIFGRSIHYVVIGGWLNEFLDEHVFLINILKKFDGIYVETSSMKKSLQDIGFDNVFVMPNFKKLDIVDESDIQVKSDKPYKLCTFSRVMQEKGIELAIDAVERVNRRAGSVVFSLDIFGQVDESYEERFTEIKEHLPEYIKYKGLVSFNDSVSTIKKYYALLFPTYYSGEGFAGTLLDAMASGVPVVASDWKYNSEIIRNGVNGVLFKTKDIDEFTDKLESIAEDTDGWQKMKVNCIREAEKYKPESSVKVLIDNIGLD
ncbi:glycosyltransferase [uncultured Ligilactobacillus sp.]|uniref:glycosyltransferase family 4 protein n=1 Tax=uncultured Ligilactobacillus sp. TaxID=2837633 RepID=UPI00259B61E6|nr:glycosyltransferase [uncultured Ligilactobacillus sp.]